MGLSTMGSHSNPAQENGFTVITTVGMGSYPARGEWVHCNYHSGNGIFSIHWRMGWWDFPQWEVAKIEWVLENFPSRD